MKVVKTGGIAGIVITFRLDKVVQNIKEIR